MAPAFFIFSSQKLPYKATTGYDIPMHFLFTVIFLPAALIIFIFEVFMFVHAIRNQRISNDRRILWLIGMLLFHPFVAIAYYFTDRQAH